MPTRGQPGSNSPAFSRRRGQTRRRARVLHSGDQKDGGDHLRDAGSEPRRVVAVAGAGVARNVAGDDLGGRRSSGEVEPVARGHGEVRGVVLRHPRGEVSAVACSESSQRGCGYDGDVRWRRRASAPMAMVVRGRGRARGEGETGQ